MCSSPLIDSVCPGSCYSCKLTKSVSWFYLLVSSPEGKKPCKFLCLSTEKGYRNPWCHSSFSDFPGPPWVMGLGTVQCQALTTAACPFLDRRSSHEYLITVIHKTFGAKQVQLLCLCGVDVLLWVQVWLFIFKHYYSSDEIASGCFHKSQMLPGCHMMSLFFPDCGLL